MHPIVRALFSAWDLRPEVLLVLGTMLLLYCLGWWRIRSRNPQSKLATKWRLASYLSGIFLVAAMLLSPVDALSGQLFFMHMTQHMVMITFAAPLLWLGNPFPISMWALPKPINKLISRLISSNSLLRPLFVGITSPGVSWFIFLAVYLGWHDPNLYNSALYHDRVHDLQHVTFFLAALLYWWPIFDGAPKFQKRMSTPARLAYLLGVIPPTMAAGIVIATSPVLIYTYYDSVPNIWGMDKLYDQAMAGAIMWIPGNEMQVQVAVILLYRWLSYDAKQEQKRSMAAIPAVQTIPAVQSGNTTEPNE